jgi:hypothetical protein
MKMLSRVLILSIFGMLFYWSRLTMDRNICGMVWNMPCSDPSMESLDRVLIKILIETKANALILAFYVETDNICCDSWYIYLYFQRDFLKTFFFLLFRILLSFWARPRHYLNTFSDEPFSTTTRGIFTTKLQ